MKIKADCSVANLTCNNNKYALNISFHSYKSYLHMYLPFATLAILENVPQGKKKVLKPAKHRYKYFGMLT